MSRLFTAALALVLSIAVLGGQQGPSTANPAAPQRGDAQTPPVTFRSQVDYVEVDAVVRDAKGAFVRDLRPDEFQVLEDGVPQKVTAFSLVDIPIVQADRALYRTEDIEPDVRSNTEESGGRIYVLLLDDLHTAFERSGRVRQMARQFIERNVGANDIVAVMHTSGRTDAAQDFTNSRRLMLQAVDKFMGRKLRSAFLNKLDVYNRNRSLGDSSTIADADDAERVQQARNVLGTIRNVSDWLGNVRGRRKAVILVGEGIDYPIAGPGSSPDATDATSSAGSGNTSTDTGSSSSSLSPSAIPMKVAENRGDGAMLAGDSRDAIAAAMRANVNIYAIDPRGLATGNEDLMTVSGSLPNDQSLGLNSTDLAAEMRRGQDSLRVLSEQTGGFASVSSNDFRPAFQRIVEENSSYYLLGYHPTNEKRNEGFRRIVVRLTRPGLAVKARAGYSGSSGKPSKDAKEKKVEATTGTSKELRETLDNPLPTPDFRFAVFAAPMKGTGKKAAIAVVSQFDGRDMAFRQGAARRTNALEVSYVAVNSEGKVAGGNREIIDLTVKPDTYKKVLESGFRLQSRFELPPGSYQLRVGAREAGGGRLGSVYYDLVVPDFTERDLDMSGLVLTSKSAAAVPTAGAIPELGDVLGAPPTTARTFRTGDELAVFAEIYDNEARRKHTVEVSTKLQAEGTTPVFSNTESRSSEELGGSRGGYGHVARIPLSGLAPGLYVLRVEAKSTLKGANAVAREVQVRIVP